MMSVRTSSYSANFSDKMDFTQLQIEMMALSANPRLNTKLFTTEDIFALVLW